MTKPFAQCSLPDFALEISLAARAAAGSALDAAAAAQLLPRLADAEATEAALQRHPLVRGAGGLVCIGAAESRQAWCSMLRDLFSVSGAAVSDAVLLRVYLVCKECARRGHVQSSDSAAAACVGAYRMLNGENVSQNQTPVDKLCALIRTTPRYAEFAQDMAATIQRQEGKENAAALVTLMSDKKQLRIELEVAWFSCQYKDFKQTWGTCVSYGLRNKPAILRQLLTMDINRKAAVRAALEESYIDMAL